jgi:hypothetical protein
MMTATDVIDETNTISMTKMIKMTNTINMKKMISLTNMTNMISVTISIKIVQEAVIEEDQNQKNILNQKSPLMKVSHSLTL